MRPDQDGYSAISWGGTDCDDLVPEINPGADEECDRAAGEVEPLR